MIGKITIILLILGLCSLIDGKRSFHDDDDIEIDNNRAQMFLRTLLDNDLDDGLFGKREWGTNCTACKFKVNPCCYPNKCRKKFPWNECMEFKNK